MTFEPRLLLGGDAQRNSRPRLHVWLIAFALVGLCFRGELANVELDRKGIKNDETK